jgi:hypothetical protein
VNSYRLIKPVTIRGILRPAGSIVALDDRKAAWFAEQGAIAVQGIVARAAPQTKPVRQVGGCAGCGR